jgi:hypothetical protein
MLLLMISIFLNLNLNFYFFIILFIYLYNLAHNLHYYAGNIFNNFIPFQIYLKTSYSQYIIYLIINVDDYYVLIWQ